MNDILIHTIKDFNLYKQKIIDLIYKIPHNPYDNIFHTDWNLPRGMRREYLEYLNSTKILENFIKDFYKFLNITSCKIDIKIGSIWFQVYKKNNYHDYHTHGECNFTNVMYLKLPDANLKTDIRGPGERSIKYKIEEGQILSFPSYFWHCSPINKLDSEKIIVSFNTNLFTVQK